MASGVNLDLLQFFAVGAIAFPLLLAIIVFVHEYGHFITARLCGVRVDVFSIGFGKPFLKWTDRHGTEWRISPIPLGGFVKFFGDADAASSADPNIVDQNPVTTQFPRPGEGQSKGLTPEEKKVCFHFKPVWQRALIVGAGPMSNFLLALAIFWAFFFAFGIKTFEPVVGSVVPGSAAEAAGIQPGDEIVSVDGRKVETFNDLSQIIMLSAGESLTIKVARKGQEVTLTATPRRGDRPDGLGNQSRVGILGVSVDESRIIEKRLGPGEALGAAAQQVYKVLEGTVRFLGRLVQGKEDASQLGGPVKVFQYSSQAMQLGPEVFINLAAVMSISIGFLNLLPVPVLDGGHLMYYAYEAATGRPLGARAQAIGFRIGLVLLVSFMLFVTWNDIRSLIS